MSMELNMPAWQKLVDENTEWLLQQPRSLERSHIASCLEWLRDNKPIVDTINRKQVEIDQLKKAISEIGDNTYCLGLDAIRARCYKVLDKEF